MSDLYEHSIASPCIGVCRLNAATGLCDGCLRSGGEIAAWLDMPVTVRLAIMAQLQHRRPVRRQGE